MAKLLRIWQTKGGATINGTDYQFDDFDSVSFTYSRKKHLMRGANGTNKYGIDTEEGIKTSDKAVVTIVDCSTEVYDLLKKCFNDNTRITLYFIDSDNLGKVTFNNAKISDMPRQTSIGEEDSTLSFQLAVESFDVSLA